VHYSPPMCGYGKEPMRFGNEVRPREACRGIGKDFLA